MGLVRLCKYNTISRHVYIYRKRRRVIFFVKKSNSFDVTHHIYQIKIKELILYRFFFFGLVSIVLDTFQKKIIFIFHYVERLTRGPTSSPYELKNLSVCSLTQAN